MAEDDDVERHMDETVVLAHPGDLNTLTGGYHYDRRLVAGLRDLGWRVETLHLSDRFPFPDATDLEQADRSLRSLPDGSRVIVDGLAFGAMPWVAYRHRHRLALVALVHHPICDETGLDASLAATAFDRERRALDAAGHVICTSNATARRLADFGVGPQRVTVIEPGVDQVAPAPCARCDGNFTILTVGTLTRRKGHDVLLDALEDLADLPWNLTIVGATDRDPQVAQAIRQRAAMPPFVGRVTVTGDVPAHVLDKIWLKADLFALASRYEGYGMVITEAVARGLPVVSTRAGAIAEIAPRDASILVPSESPRHLAGALRDTMTDPGLWRTLRTGALNARHTLRRWESVALEAAAILGRRAAMNRPKEEGFRR